MKKRSSASKAEKHWTVLLVDGQGRIRRIPQFRRKMWIVAGIGAGALILAAVMGVLYAGTLQKHRTLAEETATLQDKLAALRLQNELLKARAVRLETLVGTPQTGGETRPSGPPSSAKAGKQGAASAEPDLQAAATQTDDAAPASPPKQAEAPAAAKPAPNQPPQVDAEGLKVLYRPQTQTVEARFVIKNTGDVPAGGRAVVVLETKEGPSQIHLALPTVPLRDGRPVGNQGRRFSISRFMTVELERKFAEPGTQFAGAVVYAYTTEGRQLLEKPFAVTLAIPEEEKAPAPEAAVPAAAPLGLSLPEPESTETTGVQP